jgi:hypothetical protein
MKRRSFLALVTSSLAARSLKPVVYQPRKAHLGDTGLQQFMAEDSVVIDPSKARDYEIFVKPCPYRFALSSVGVLFHPDVKRSDLQAVRDASSLEVLGEGSDFRMLVRTTGGGHPCKVPVTIQLNGVVEVQA